MLTRVEDAPNEACHELRKRVKDLGYQLALLEPLRGVKALLAKLDAVGSALGDARDLSLLRDYLGKVRDQRPLTAGEQRSYFWPDRSRSWRPELAGCVRVQG